MQLNKRKEIETMSKQIFFICVVVIFTFLNCSTKKTTAEGDPLYLPSEIITDNIMSHLSVVADTIYELGIENPILINIKLYYKDIINTYTSLDPQKLDKEINDELKKEVYKIFPITIRLPMS